MDYDFSKRRKKSDKKKEKNERNGKFSTEHVRIIDALKHKKGMIICQNDVSEEEESKKKNLDEAPWP